MTNYISFIIISIIAITSFILSFLWTKRVIKDHILIVFKGIQIRTRNLIDLLMIVSRAVLPLPFIEQPRINSSLVISIIGVVIFSLGIIFIVLSFSKLYQSLLYGKNIKLVTTGVYSIIRHPIYFGDSIWPLGWSLIYGGICSALLTPIWFFTYILTAIEEEKVLLLKYGKDYEDYMKRVKRIIPFIY